MAVELLRVLAFFAYMSDENFLFVSYYEMNISDKEARSEVILKMRNIGLI